MELDIFYKKYYNRFRVKNFSKIKNNINKFDHYLNTK